MPHVTRNLKVSKRSSTILSMPPTTSSSTSSNSTSREQIHTSDPDLIRKNWPRARARRRNPETETVKACLLVLRLHGIMANRQQTTTFMAKTGQLVKVGIPGAADISGMLPNGVRIEVEVKQPGNKPTPEQWRWLGEINRYHGIGIVAYSAAHLEFRVRQLKAHLQALGLWDKPLISLPEGWATWHEER